MSYDTGMPTEALYERMVAWQVQSACDAVDGTPCELMFGVPTYKEHTPAHHPSAEHMVSGLQGIGLGLYGSSHRTSFRGIAVYAEWTTQPADWDQLNRLYTAQATQPTLP